MRSGRIAGAIVLAGLIALAPGAGAGGVVRVARWQTMGSFLRLTIELSEAVKNNVRNEISEKELFYIELDGITQGFKSFPPPPGGMGVRRIQSSYYPSHDLQRFVFHVDPGVKFEVTSLVNPPRLVVDIARENRPLSQTSTSKKVVVIDPGHGGVSTGARSRSLVGGRYVWEKDVVLSYARRLEQLINQSPNMRAVLTRRDDSYVSLNDRVRFAVEHDGDVFISLHCNSTPGTRPVSAEGLEIYTWNEKAIADAALKYLESLENDAEVSIRVNGRRDPTLKKVLGNMLGDILDQQKSLSELLAREVYGAMTTKLDYYRNRGRGVKSARFKVLENYEMPAILIELGFMPNPREVKKLCDPQFQDESVRAIYNGLCAYFSQSDKTFSPRYIEVAGH
ncbi:MAG: hypothetical protein Kow0059_11790 [Candidatus Sumerlaeia bacterium]